MTASTVSKSSATKQKKKKKKSSGKRRESIRPFEDDLDCCRFIIV